MSGAAPAVATPPPETSPARTGMKMGLIGIVVSGVLVAALYSQIDRRAILTAFTSADPLWLGLSIGTTVPITLLVALRFLWASPSGSLPGYGEAVRLTLVAKAFNLFLPSKSGDLVKSYFVAKRGRAPVGVALSIIVYERLCDLLGLISWCLIGWALSPPPVGVLSSSGWVFLAVVALVCLVLVSSERSAGWILALVHRLLPSRRLQKLRDLAAGWPGLHRAIRGRRRWIVLVTIALWLGNMTQLWLLTLAVRAPVPFTDSLGIFALTVVAGQLPLTFAGFGARDVALVVLLSSHMPAGSAAAIGLLSATIGILPALAAAPIVRPYLAVAAGEAARWRQR